MGEGTPLHGDRAAWDVLNYEDEHGSDIEAGTLTRHTPLPPGTAGYALVSNATSLGWDQSPTWTGVHTFEAGAAIAAGQGLAVGGGSWVGIAGNELLTFHAAGYVTVTGAKFGVGTSTPAYDIDVHRGTSPAVQSLRTFSTTADATSWLFLMRSHHNTPGNLGETADGDYLGGVRFYGVNTIPDWDPGAEITAIQRGAASGVFNEADLILETYKTTAKNTNQLVLDGGTGFVGVNTLAPAATFNVVGDLMVGATTMHINPIAQFYKGNSTVSSPVESIAIFEDDGDGLIEVRCPAANWSGIRFGDDKDDGPTILGHGGGHGTVPDGLSFHIGAAFDAADPDVSIDNVGLVDIKASLDVGYYIYMTGQLIPDDPPNDQSVLWRGAGGDLKIKITEGAVTKTAVIVDYSAL